MERWGARSHWLPLVETTLSGLKSPSNLAVISLTSCLMSGPTGQLQGAQAMEN